MGHLIALFIPLIVGFLWYSKVLFGNSWMKLNGLTDEDLKKGSFAKILILTVLLSILLVGGVNLLVVHEFGFFSMMAEQPEVKAKSGEAFNLFKQILNDYGFKHGNFGHGFFHGATGAIVTALPLIGINALFERRSGKYIFIHAGYWIITMGLMGGCISQFTDFAALFANL